MKRSFRLEFEGDYLIPIEELWPDDDAPEIPTTQDAIRLIEKHGLSTFLFEWDYRYKLRVLIDGQEVEF